MTTSLVLNILVALAAGQPAAPRSISAEQRTLVEGLEKASRRLERRPADRLARDLAGARAKLAEQQREAFVLDLALRAREAGITRLERIEVLFVERPWESRDRNKALAFDDGVKFIYGDDGRTPPLLRARNLRDALPPDVDPWAFDWQLASARAVALMAPASRVALHRGGAAELGLERFQYLGYEPCPDERFREERVAGFCTAFWIGDNRMATAGHCAQSDASVEQTYFFFEYFADASGPTATFLPSHTYRGVRLAHHDAERDIAVVELDRVLEIPGARPLVLRAGERPPVGTPVGLIGHPAGLPTKLAFAAVTLTGGESRIRKIEADGFEADVDAFGGNSGSPVIAATPPHEVQGILVSGRQDFALETNYTYGCFSSRKGDPDELAELERAVWSDLVLPAGGER